MVLLLVFMQLTRDLFAIAKFLLLQKHLHASDCNGVHSTRMNIHYTHDISWRQSNCARYYLEDSGIFILKIQDSILSCIFGILLKSIFDKEEDSFEDTFHEILFVLCVRYSTRIISQPFVHLQGTIYGYAYITRLHEIIQWYWSKSHPIMVRQQYMQD